MQENLIPDALACGFPCRCSVITGSEQSASMPQVRLSEHPVQIPYNSHLLGKSSRDNNRISVQYKIHVLAYLKYSFDILELQFYERNLSFM